LQTGAPSVPPSATTSHNNNPRSRQPEPDRVSPSTVDTAVATYQPLSGNAVPWTFVPDVSASETRRASEVARRRLDLTCRALNILVAVVGLILALPLMLIIAMAIKTTSKGPIIFRQRRVGIDRRGRAEGPDLGDRRAGDQGGRIFTIYKFRTMIHRPHAVAQVWAAQDDPRTTAVGRVLRKYRLDEIPQLVNVLRGEMNVVGPRPEQPKIFEELRSQVRDYPLRQRVLPGITGWAQINHSYDRSMDDVRTKVQLDLEYIERRSAAEDLRIMARTIPVIVLKRGAI
jgi:lipopolysaccharide/colanic/teichoic acid biosynthesis glycosyltransferase